MGQLLTVILYFLIVSWALFSGHQRYQSPEAGAFSAAGRMSSVQFCTVAGGKYTKGYRGQASHEGSGPNGANDETLTTCTMIITEANSFIGAIHDRMPLLCWTERAPKVGFPARGPGMSC